MRRFAPTLFVLVTLFVSSALAGPIERALESKWRGAWVVIGAEVRSNCNSSHTNNRVNGTLVEGRGRLRFPEGELAQIGNLGVKRSRVDLLLTLYEPRLVAHQEGPFTLYDRLECRVELEIEVPREMVRNKQIDQIDAVILKIMDRYANFQQAQDSNLWNGRECQEFPEDYDQTLQAHARWQAEQVNAGVDAKLAETEHALDSLTGTIESDTHYLAGFADGVDEARRRTFSYDCSAMLRESLTRKPEKAPAKIAKDAAAKRRWERGYSDGYLLVRALGLRQRLPGCYVPVP